VGRGQAAAAAFALSAVVGAGPAAAPAVRSSVPAVWHSDIGYCSRSTLLRVDPDTLEPLRGPRLGVRDDFHGPTLSPNRGEAALDGAGPARIVLADIQRMRRLGTVRLGGVLDDAETIAWTRPRMLVALDVRSDAHRVALTKVVAVDPRERRILSAARFSWWAALAHGETRGGRVVLLLAAWTHLTAPLLVVVDRDGAIRQLALDRLVAGVGYAPPDEIRRFPALALDPVRERALVVDEGEPVAEVDLRTLAVTYHAVAGLAVADPALAGPAQETGTDNPVRGPRRLAVWLDGGIVAVSGYDSYTGSIPSGGWGDSAAPAGLQLLDTRTWTVRTIDRLVGASWEGGFRYLRGRILAGTWAWDAARHRYEGYGLVAFDSNGKLVYRKGAAPKEVYWTVLFDRLFFGRPRSRSFDRLDIATGRRTGTVPQGRIFALDAGFC
jgi:hypothetical protein